MLATFITRDGFRRKEVLYALMPHYSFARPGRRGLAHKIPDINDKGFDRIDFYLEKHEKGPKGVIYATYKEI